MIPLNATSVLYREGVADTFSIELYLNKIRIRMRPTKLYLVRFKTKKSSEKSLQANSYVNKNVPSITCVLLYLKKVFMDLLGNGCQFLIP